MTQPNVIKSINKVQNMAVQTNKSVKWILQIILHLHHDCSFSIPRTRLALKIGKKKEFYSRNLRTLCSFVNVHGCYGGRLKEPVLLYSADKQPTECLSQVVKTYLLINLGKSETSASRYLLTGVNFPTQSLWEWQDLGKQFRIRTRYSVSCRLHCRV